MSKRNRISTPNFQPAVTRRDEPDFALAREEETLSLERHGASPHSAAPQLFLVLQSQNPLATSARHGLAAIDEVCIGRGEYGFARESHAGERRLTLRIPDPRMSGAHASLLRSGERFVLRDAGSKNGSFVNGVRHRDFILADGDLLQLGSTFFSFRYLGTQRDDHVASVDASVPPGLQTLLPDLQQTFAKLERIARTRVPVLVLGESGTGKELVARAIHQLSGRPGAFVPVNCGALPSSLLEAELFGYRKGAFSGATEDRPGLVRASDAGTLLLDEIGDLPATAQPALLRVLQEREVTPVGGSRATGVDLRVVAATHRDLYAPDAKHPFRADLRSRLDGWTVRLPPLRERREDLGLIIGALLRRLDYDTRPVSLSAHTVNELLAYHWPLNIRELEQRLQAAIALTTGDSVRFSPLPDTSSALTTRDVEREPSAPAPSGRSLSAADRTRRELLADLLARHEGNISAVARELGKERGQIRRWLKRYDLKSPGR